jgi:tRNA-dihydrouridine synthase
LRDALSIKFTVKSRLGFDSLEHFDAILEVFAKHAIDLVTIHGRTVAEMYRSAVHYDYIEKAVTRLDCPVLANGNVYSAEHALRVLELTGAKGLMVGRGAIRNPWLFQQIRQKLRGQEIFVPAGRQVLAYVTDLFHSVRPPECNENAHVQKMKKFMNFLGIGVEPAGMFLHEIRRVSTERDFFAVCHRWLDHSDLMPLEPFDLNLKATDVMAGEHS